MTILYKHQSNHLELILDDDFPAVVLIAVLIVVVVVVVVVVPDEYYCHCYFSNYTVFHTF
jgi:hypothetical protein